MPVRTYLKTFREPFYLLFFIPQFACVSWGWGSADWPYRAAFAAGIPFLLLCMACEEYSLREAVKMAAFAVLIAWAYMQNRNRSLILACMAIYGVKGLDLKRILRWAFWVMLICMSLKVALCAAGILPNKVLELPKENGVMYMIRCYGYDTPNNLFFHLVTVVLMAMALYGDAFRWPALLVVLLMYGAYRVLISRTGWLCFLALAALYLSVSYLHSKKKEGMLSALRILMVLSPAFLFLLNLFLIYLQRIGMRVIVVVNRLLNGRLFFANEAFENIGISLLGSKNAVQLDMLYATMLLNYGVLLSIICIGAYSVAMWKLRKKKEDLLLIAMTVMAIYSFMEVNAINPMWNPFLLYVSVTLFETDDFTLKC